MKHTQLLVWTLLFMQAGSITSQVLVYRNQQYGITLSVKHGELLCKPPIYNGNGSDHGAQLILGTTDASLCSQSTGKRYMSIWASYTLTDEEKSIHSILESECKEEIDRVCSPAPASLYIKGLKTENGKMERPDGSSKIIVVTMAGKPNPNFDAAVPSFNYVLSLVTDSQHFNNDLKTFRKMLKRIQISPPN